MSDTDLQPLSPDVQKLLEEAPRPSVPECFEARLLSRIQGTMAALPAEPGPSSEPVSPTAAAATSTTVTSATAGSVTALGAWGIPVSLATLAIGAAAGFFAGRASAPTQTRVEYVAVESTAPQPVAPPAPSAAMAPPVDSENVPAQPPAASKVTPAPDRARGPAAQAQQRSAETPERGRRGRDTDLADERALVEIGRTALARRDFDAAIDALTTHGRRYPEGQLVEEREVLLVQALAASGRAEEARRRADAFKKRYPDSMLRPLMDAVVRPAPER